MLSRPIYRFSPEALEFQVVRSSPSQWLWHHAWMAMAALSLAGLVYLSPVGKALVQWRMAAESHYLNQQILRQEQTLAQLEERLERIHRHEQEFYRSLLDVPPMEASLWEGGTGGSPAASDVPARRLMERIETLKHRIGLQRQNHTELIATARAKSEALSRLPVLVPVRGHFISGFGYRNSPIHGHTHFHSGIDFAAPMGTPVYAANEGKVITAGWPESGYGLQIEIAHGNGFVTKYAHLSRLDVQEGQRVKRGQLIGRVGSTGQSIGPHLHYEVIRRGAKINPAPYLLLPPGNER